MALANETVVIALLVIGSIRWFAEASCSLTFGVNLKCQAGDRQQWQDRCKPLVVVHDNIGPLCG